jgi:hypothetical protein
VDTSTWIAYTSERYGFDIKRPPDWNETAANHDWTLPDAADPSSTAAELFEYPVEGQGIIATAFSVAVEPGTTADEWFDAYCRINSAPCSALQAVAVPASMDGHPGSLVVFANDVQAFVLVDDRMYVVAEWRPDNDGTLARYGGGRRLVEAFLSTMTLRSWSGPAPVASPPALAESFTSTLYGYSVEYPSGVWAVTAGTRVWIPGMPAGSASDRFEPSPGSDGFRATSALIPDGVTPDATWIGQNITDIGGECSPPSSTLGTIVIDGHEGRIRTSCHEVEATVILDSRIYMFTFFDIDFGGPYSTAGARALFEAMMASVQLTPETAVSPSPAPS